MIKIKIWISTASFCALLLASTSARADRVSQLAGKLKNNPSHKVRLTAALMLSKYADPRSISALIYALENDSDTRVRGFAAMALGRFRAPGAIPGLKKAARSGDNFLKSKARGALEKLCPSSLSGKRYYLKIVVRPKGALKHISKGLAMIKLSRIAGGRSDSVTGWPGCGSPSASALRRKRMKGFFLDASIKVIDSGGNTSVHVSVLFTTYPGKSLKGNAGAKAAVPGSPSVGTVTQLVDALIGSIKGDINTFLNSNP